MYTLSYLFAYDLCVLQSKRRNQQGDDGHHGFLQSQSQAGGVSCGVRELTQAFRATVFFLTLFLFKAIISQRSHCLQNMEGGLRYMRAQMHQLWAEHLNTDSTHTPHCCSWTGCSPVLPPIPPLTVMYFKTTSSKSRVMCMYTGATNPSSSLIKDTLIFTWS